MIILALDALDLEQVKKYGCKHLLQQEYGKTDLSDFKQPRTVVLWASFLTGKNMEPKIPLKTQWEFKLKPEQTFLKFSNKYKTIDLPAFSHKPSHTKERKLLKGYFEEKSTIEEYDKHVWKTHEENKTEFFEALNNFDLLLGYFNLADSIGHLSFGIEEKMTKVYQELDDLAKKVMESVEDTILIISDHGMKPIGRYGDHNQNGFYSFNKNLGLNMPKITSFYDLIRKDIEK
jgi:hypothetical protein